MNSRELKLIFLVLDLLVLNASILLVLKFRADINIDTYHDLGVHFLHADLSWFITYILFSKKNLYLRDNFKNRIARITKRTTIFFIIASFIAFITLGHKYTPNFLTTYTLVSYFGKILIYFILYKFLKFKRSKGLGTDRVLVVGYNETTCFLQKILNSNHLLSYSFIGFLDEEADKDAQLLGQPKDLEKLIDKHNIQVVFVSLSLLGGLKNSKDYIRICHKKGIRLRFVPENQRWLKSRINMETIGNLVVINPQEIPLDNMISRYSKRLFDVCFSLFVIIGLLSWMLPILALIIKLNSRGPVFFKQKRTGINNKTFYCYKFRSMCTNQQADTQQSRQGDIRITSIGHFLRRTSIDELPQFFNVLMGNMSIVGPRPHMLQHTDKYSALIDDYLIRHFVKPGITGWAQVNGYRGETDELWKMEKRVKLDMEYVENWTFLWDLHIIWLTVFSPQTSINAY